jgi:hypothetical protein
MKEELSRYVFGKELMPDKQPYKHGETKLLSTPILNCNKRLWNFRKLILVISDSSAAMCHVLRSSLIQTVYPADCSRTHYTKAEAITKAIPTLDNGTRKNVEIYLYLGGDLNK